MDFDLEFYEKLDEFLKKNGVRELPSSNKEKLKILRQITYNEKVNVDCLELAYQKNKGTDKAIPLDEYLDLTHRLEINSHIASYLAANLKMVVKEEQRLERLAKIKTLFKRK